MTIKLNVILILTTVDFVRQTSQSFEFCYLVNTLKDRLSKTSGWQFHEWLFGPEKSVFGTFEKRPQNGM